MTLETRSCEHVYIVKGVKSALTHVSDTHLNY